jgi:competence protein ComGC
MLLLFYFYKSFKKKLNNKNQRFVYKKQKEKVHIFFLINTLVVLVVVVVVLVVSTTSTTTDDHVGYDRAHHTAIARQILDHERLHADRMTTGLEHFTRVKSIIGQELFVYFYFHLSIVTGVFET